MRLIYYGDGPWAALSLKQIVAAGHDVPAVVVRSKTADTTLVEAAKELNLPVLCPDKVNAPEFLQKVRELAPDLNVSVSYDQILRREIIASAPLGFINIHAGKLPFYRGRNIINWAIINGETEIGLTVHYVNEDIDTGDIIVQRVMPIAWEDTYAEVLQRIIDAVPGTIMEAIRLVGEGKAPRRSQEKFQGTYYASRINGDEWIDWTDTSRNIYNKIRAITRPAPGARTLLDGKPVLLWRASYDPAWPKYIAVPGQIVGRVEGRGVIVKTGDSTILIEEVQSEEQPAQSPKWRIGTRLGYDWEHAGPQLLKRVEQLETLVQKLQSA